MIRYLLLTLLFLGCSGKALAQADHRVPSPRGAFLRSLAVPGWGHYYVDHSQWNRGKYHLAAEVILVVSYLGFSIHSNNLQQNWYGYARTEGHIDVSSRGREVQLAVGNFNNLQAYNDYQLRSRNWDRLINDVPQNQWSWQNDAARQRYNHLRSRFENINQQLPALIGLMVVNRLISAISAYNRARKAGQSTRFSAVSLLPVNKGQGVVAKVQLGW